MTQRNLTEKNRRGIKNFFAEKKALRSGLLAILLLPCLATFSPARGAAQDKQPDAPQGQIGDQRQAPKCLKCKIGGLHVAVWKPAGQGKSPLVIFSHGSGGKNTKSRFITEALARSGYLVIAPNHRDSTLTGISLRPDFTFKRASKWDDKMYEARRTDIVNLLAALHGDQDWDSQIDWSRLGLCGHSLGGYTVLGLCGAWPSWKIDGVKAVLGFSPYCQPFVLNGKLGDMAVPAMYQGGTKDSITQSVVCKGGAFDQTSPPAYFVEFDRAGHLAWTNFKHNKKQLTAYQLLLTRFSLTAILRPMLTSHEMPDSIPSSKAFLCWKKNRLLP